MLQKHPFFNREKPEFHYYDCLPKRPSSDFKTPTCFKKNALAGGEKTFSFMLTLLGASILMFISFPKHLSFCNMIR